MKSVSELPNSGLDDIWAPPVIFKAGLDDTLLEGLISDGNVTSKNDGLKYLLDDLNDYYQPLDEQEKYERVTSGDTDAYGNWIYFPWQQAITRYPEYDDFEAIRTSRNRNLITPVEQKKLGRTTVAVFGLSVGSNIVRQFAQTGIGDKYIIGDMDRVSASNLNRAPYTMANLGCKKTIALARLVAEIDPYINQTLLNDGYIGGETDDLLDREAPSVIIDAVDSMPAKVQMREYAKEAGVPLIMATDVGERVLVDVENYRDYPRTELFNGRISYKDTQALKTGNSSNRDKNKIVGLANISTRMIESILDNRLGGMPQLGSTAVNAATNVDLVTQDLILGRDVKSGRRIADRRKNMHGEKLATMSEYTDAVLRALRYLKMTEADK